MTLSASSLSIIGDYTVYPRILSPIRTLALHLGFRKTSLNLLVLNPGCNNSGYECCGKKEGRNNRKEYHSTSRARKVRSEIVASYCNILKVSQVLAFSTLGRCSFPFYRRMEGAPRLTYGTTRVHSL